MIGRIAHRRRVMVAAALLGLVLADGGGASAEQTALTNGVPGHGTVGPDQRALAAAGSGGGTVPPLVVDPNGDTNSWDTAAETTVIATRSKLSVNLTASRLLGYLDFCLAGRFPDANAPGGVGTFESCCPPDAPATCDRINPPRSSADAEEIGLTHIRAKGPAWLQSPPGSPKPFGLFADVKIRALAFGSIPVTATLHISQPTKANGEVRPLIVSIGTSSEYRPGVVVEGYGTVPESKFQPGRGAFVYPRSYLRGQILLRLSDVAVDGHPIDVGPRCAPARPSALEVGTPAGFVPAPAFVPKTPISAYRGRPGSIDFGPGGQLYGSIAIPAFVGCGTSSQDLDPLVTSLVSSPRNAVTVTTTQAIDRCLDRDPAVPACPPHQEIVPPQAAASAATTSSSERAALRGMLHSTDPRVRRLMPPHVRAQLRAMSR